MACIDLFMAILDSLSIYSRGYSLSIEDDNTKRVALILAVIFFSIRLLLYIPIAYFTIKVFAYTSKTGGKALYGLKLAIFILFILFNIVGLGFLTDRGCTVMHTKIPNLDVTQK